MCKKSMKNDEFDRLSWSKTQNVINQPTVVGNIFQKFYTSFENNPSCAPANLPDLPKVGIYFGF